MQTTSTTTTTAAATGWPLSAHERYAVQASALREEAQERINTRMAQGFSPGEALAYAAPQLRAAIRGRALHATCLLELGAQH